MYRALHYMLCHFTESVSFLKPSVINECDLIFVTVSCFGYYLILHRIDEAVYLEHGANVLVLGVIAEYQH